MAPSVAWSSGVINANFTLPVKLYLVYACFEFMFSLIATLSFFKQIEDKVFPYGSGKL